MYEVHEAAKRAQVIQILLPDELHAKVYRDHIKPHLNAGDALVFSHGFSIHFEQVVPPKDVDVVLVAPKGPRSSRAACICGRIWCPCTHCRLSGCDGKSKRALHWLIPKE